MKLGEAESLIEKAAKKVISEVVISLNQKNIELAWDSTVTLNGNNEIIRYFVFSKGWFLKTQYMMLQFSIENKNDDWNIKPKVPIYCYAKKEFFDVIDLVIKSKKKYIAETLGSVNIKMELL